MKRDCTYLKKEDMLVISMKEFSANHRKYLELIKEGEEVVLKSKENGSFSLEPVAELSESIPKEYILMPDGDLKRAITGTQLLEGLIPRVETLFDK